MVKIMMQRRQGVEMTAEQFSKRVRKKCGRWTKECIQYCLYGRWARYDNEAPDIHGLSYGIAESRVALRSGSKHSNFAEFISRVAIDLKKKAPNAHTFLEFLAQRFDVKNHRLMLGFALMINIIIVTAMVILGGAIALNSCQDE